MRATLQYLVTHGGGRRLILLALLLIVVSNLTSILIAYQVSNVQDTNRRIAQTQLASCETGNEGRAHIRNIARVLKRLVDVSISLPPPRGSTLAQLAVRAGFHEGSRELAVAIKVLRPRSCAPSASGARPAK